MFRSAHVDTFTRDNLPPRELWPDFLLSRPEVKYPERLNATVHLLDRWLATGHGARPCIVTDAETLSYRELAERVNRLANVLVGELGLKPGNRVLLRGPNSPMMATAYLAVIKAGGVAVGTMPLLRAKEIAYPLNKALIGLALCDHRLADDLVKAKETAPALQRIAQWGAGGPDDLVTRMAAASPEFTACDTAQDDVCLIAFTSGTTGEPKGTMHFHRDLLACGDTYGRHVLHATADDLITGSPPLAFTFGLGGLLLFPLRAGAAALLVERPAPDELIASIARHGASICFTAPTAYRAMLAKLGDYDLACLRTCVSAGETLPKATWEAWHKASGIPILDGIGSTKMLHIFIGSPADEVRAGSTGKPVPGYEAKIIDEQGRELAPGEPGRLAVRGPTGCRYLADERQRRYVEAGWNVTGDTYLKDADGYYWYQARSDDMIISAGYNIAGPEIEATLLTHPTVAECGVVGAPDEERGMIVKAYVVLKPGTPATAETVKLLQDYVKAEIAPYKYPREIEFLEALPRTETGKLQRFQLRRLAAERAKARAMSGVTP